MNHLEGKISSQDRAINEKMDNVKENLDRLREMLNSKRPPLSEKIDPSANRRFERFEDMLDMLGEKVKELGRKKEDAGAQRDVPPSSSLSPADTPISKEVKNDFKLEISHKSSENSTLACLYQVPSVMAQSALPAQPSGFGKKEIILPANSGWISTGLDVAPGRRIRIKTKSRFLLVKVNGWGPVYIEEDVLISRALNQGELFLKDKSGEKAQVNMELERF